MSGKSRKKASKVSKLPASLATVSLTVRNVENTKFLVDDFAELGIEAKFQEKPLKCKNLTERVAKVESEVSLAAVSGKGSKLSVKVQPRELPEGHFTPSETDVVFNFEIQVDVNSESEVFELLQNPVQFTLSSFGDDPKILGTTNLDLFSLCSCQVESKTCKLQFETIPSDDQNGPPLFRKIFFEVEMTSDVALLQEPIANCLYVSFDSIHNLKDVEKKISIGFRPPTGSDNKFTFECNPTTSSSDCMKFKKWMNWSQIGGRGAMTSHVFQSYAYPLSPEEDNAMKSFSSSASVDTMARIILNNAANDFLKSMIRKSKKFIFELEIGDEHVVGLVDLEDFFQLERRRVKKVVPLVKFNTEAFKQESELESVFAKSEPAKKPKASKGNKKKSIASAVSELSEIPPAKVEFVPFMNEDCQQIHFVIDLELDKPFYEEVFLDSNEPIDLPDALPEPVETMESPVDRPSKHERWHAVQKAQIYEFVDMPSEANKVFLRLIHDRPSEQSWILYAVHCLRRKNFSKTLVCVQNALTFNSDSILGHIIEAYVDFKLQKHCEVERLMDLMEIKHGNVLELSIVRHVVNVNNYRKMTHACHHSDADLKSHREIQQIYETKELLWWSTFESPNFLNWSDPLIRCAIFFIKLGCFGFAELALSEVWGAKGGNVSCNYLLGVIDALRGNHKGALIHLNKISKCDVPVDYRNYQKIVGLQFVMLMKLGNREKAEKMLHSLHDTVEVRIENFLVHFLRGKQLNEESGFQMAVPPLTQAIAMFPCAVAFNEIGKSFESLKKFDAAEKCFHQSIACDDNTEAWRHLKNVYSKQHRTELVDLCMKNFNCV